MNEPYNYVTGSMNQHPAQTMAEGMVEAAAYFYVMDSLAREAEARRQQYWANCEANERQLLVGLFNKYRVNYPDHAAAWYAEKEYSVGYHSRLTGYLRGAHSWGWDILIGSVLIFAGIASGIVSSGVSLGAFCLGIGWFWKTLRLYRGMPDTATAIIQENIRQDQFSRDSEAFQIARNGYTEGGW